MCDELKSDSIFVLMDYFKEHFDEYPELKSWRLGLIDISLIKNWTKRFFVCVFVEDGSKKVARSLWTFANPETDSENKHNEDVLALIDSSLMWVNSTGLDVMSNSEISLGTMFEMMRYSVLEHDSTSPDKWVVSPDEALKRFSDTVKNKVVDIVDKDNPIDFDVFNDHVFSRVLKSTETKIYKTIKNKQEKKFNKNQLDTDIFSIVGHSRKDNPIASNVLVDVINYALTKEKDQS